MKEILYKYSQRGMYYTEDDNSFGDDSQIKIIIGPHDFSLAIGDEVLRNTSCQGYNAIASCDGEVVFYDNNGKIIATADKTNASYEQVVLRWSQDYITIDFGCTEVVDYYPNCDGEYDRYGKEWVSKHLVTMNTKDNSIKTE